VNYIKQLNGFWQWRKLKSLSGRQADLYFAILQCFNENRWQTSLSVPNMLLSAMCEVGQRELLRNREALVEKGLIQYYSSGGNACGKYRIIPLYEDDVGQNVGQNVGRNVHYNKKEKKKKTYIYNNAGKKEQLGRLMKSDHFGNIDKWIKSVGVPLDEQGEEKADE